MVRAKMTQRSDQVSAAASASALFHLFMCVRQYNLPLGNHHLSGFAVSKDSTSTLEHPGLTSGVTATRPRPSFPVR